MKIKCNASVSLLRKNNQDNFEAIKGYEVDPYFIARYLVHRVNSDKQVNNIFRYGDFSFTFGMHDYFGEPKPNHIVSESKLTSFNSNKLNNYVGYGGFTEDNDEDMSRVSDNFFCWNGKQWQYLVENSSGRFKKFIPLKNVLKQMNKELTKY